MTEYAESFLRFVQRTEDRPWVVHVLSKRIKEFDREWTLALEKTGGGVHDSTLTMGEKICD